MVAKIHLLNTPIFFEQLFDSQIKPLLTESTLSKITMSSGTSAGGLWEPEHCPRIYGGKSQFSFEVENGPWLSVAPVYDAEESKEFEMHESDDDQVDLLGTSEGEDISDLRSQLKNSKLPAGHSNLVLPQKQTALAGSGESNHPTLYGEEAMNTLVEETGDSGSRKGISADLLSAKLAGLSLGQTPQCTQEE